MSCPVDWERPSETEKERKKPSFSVAKIRRMPKTTRMRREKGKKQDREGGKKAA
jgi:hypothetical protein